MVKRTDIHRPSVINPADYQFVSFEHIKSMGFEDVPMILACRETIRLHMLETGGTYSHHEHGGNCHICGAHCVYTALFYHKPSNTYIRTGLECCDKLDDSIDGTEFRKNIKTALEHRAGKQKAEKLCASNGQAQAYKIWAERLIPRDANGNTIGNGEELTVIDIVSRLVRYGTLSEKQWAFMSHLLDRINKRAEIAAARAAEKAAAKDAPVTGARIKIAGTIVGYKIGMFGMQMILKSTDGWMALGAVPANLSGLPRGSEVSFECRIVPSKNDPKFVYFKRPTKPSVLKEAA